MTDMIPVKDQKLARDPKTGAIHNTDKEAFLNFIAHRKSIQESKDKVANLEKEVADSRVSIKRLEDTVAELCDLVRKGSGVTKGRTSNAKK